MIAVGDPMRMRQLLILMAVLAISARADATTPMLPGQEDFERAVRAGAPSARAAFDRQTFSLLRQAQRAIGAPRKRGHVSSEYLLMELLTWYTFWIEAETYEILKEGTTADEFEPAVWHPLFRLWTQFQLCVDPLDARQLATGDSAHELRLAEQSLSQLAAAAEIEMPYKLAVLATAANRPDLVDRVLQANGGEIREPQFRGHPFYLGRSYSSAAEFTQLDHAARNQELLGRAKSALVPRVYPKYGESSFRSSARWMVPFAAFCVLLGVVLWNRQMIWDILFE
jgi:hypothetical protein